MGWVIVHLLVISEPCAVGVASASHVPYRVFVALFGGSSDFGCRGTELISEVSQGTVLPAQQCAATLLSTPARAEALGHFQEPIFCGSLGR